MGRSFLPVLASRSRAGVESGSGSGAQSVRKPRVLQKSRTISRDADQHLPNALPSIQSDPTTGRSLRIESAYSGLGYSWSDIEAVASLPADHDRGRSPAQPSSPQPHSRRPLARRSSDTHMQALTCRLVGSEDLDAGSEDGYLTTPPSAHHAYIPDTSSARIFGVPLDVVSEYGCCLAIVGGREHPLPMVVFATVEHIVRHGGLTDPTLFNLLPSARLPNLISVFDAGPYYGDDHDLEKETMADVCELLRVYLERLPEPVLDESVRSAFFEICSVAANRSRITKATKAQISAAQVLIRLLPHPQFRVLVYMLAFLAHIPRQADRVLDYGALSAIFADALLSSREACQATQTQSADSAVLLEWLLRHWIWIADGLLAPHPENLVPRDTHRSGAPKQGGVIATREESPNRARFPRRTSPTMPVQLSPRPDSALPSRRRYASPDVPLLARTPRQAVRATPPTPSSAQMRNQLSDLQEELERRDLVTSGLRARVAALEQEQRTYRDSVHEAEDAFAYLQEERELRHEAEAAAENIATRLEQCELQLDDALRRAKDAEAERDGHRRQLGHIYHVVAYPESF